MANIPIHIYGLVNCSTCDNRIVQLQFPPWDKEEDIVGCHKRILPKLFNQNTTSHYCREWERKDIYGDLRELHKEALDASLRVP